MLDIRTKVIEDIKEALNNLIRHASDPETMTAKVGLIQKKFDSLTENIKSVHKSHQIELRKEKKRAVDYEQKWAKLKKEHCKCEDKLQEYKKIFLYLKSQPGKKESMAWHQSLQYEKLHRKKLSAQKRIKDLVKVIEEMERKLKECQKIISQNKVFLEERKQSEEELFEKVFERLKKIIYHQGGNENVLGLLRSQRNSVERQEEPQESPEQQAQNAQEQQVEEAHEQPEPAQEQQEEDGFDDDEVSNAESYFSQSVPEHLPFYTEDQDLDNSETQESEEKTQEKAIMKMEGTENAAIRQQAVQMIEEISMLKQWVDWLWHLNQGH